ncbi:MAG: hypothetical protein A2725_02370 [Candidatus Magasanikbacteria bacterium RIFCSPHIGHO2_01_FULL_33_34]|uniref:N-acetyltransferase domain-containing protein n=1 Tax=Candidatus Magasanikbacteria bacterium RIFCSPHIGHO2_01_FULL_33_34 TaxID=1798671 RepID=A0A1F6LKD3_9BACT|nr:MAG: hypothetical protein A2725_02370 [Candidatus Magasanikbacteria bacterium RIFCSPHIGHO2_01_FULL_33_34]OGH65633.1 MAG: hypothetical protein A3B83_02030 [Candidatus Magasanikbacteria bacterium RIFCSPHIGHO2_02_FULL_33_17]OGH75842.1 MAG: hypothetical protein A3A89_02925 [Candidatus Magasanikbacteria bacterium RIFCSPLOWO2_01_FULL_33_34]OGH81146.1 MAG: hypothetical protein A3F93_01725 [Candidatus Magasanikbacteria bacterium RIFCSPLOWO2_12_FULL_34_7]
MTQYATEKSLEGFCTFKTIRAIDDEKSFKLSLEIQKGALKRHNVSYVSSADESKLNLNGVYLILLVDSCNKIRGCIRVHLNLEGIELPSYIAIGAQSELFTKKILGCPHGSLAEVSSLAISEELTGQSYGFKLIKMATELSFSLGVETAFGLVPRHTRKYFINLGYVPDEVIPPVVYPEGYLSQVVWKGV